MYSIPNTVQIRYFFYQNVPSKIVFIEKYILYFKNGLQNELYECTRLSKKQVLDRHIKMWLSVLSYLLCVLFDYISIIFL